MAEAFVRAGVHIRRFTILRFFLAKIFICQMKVGGSIERDRKAYFTGFFFWQVQHF